MERENNLQFNPETEGKLRLWLERYYPEYKARHRKDETKVFVSDSAFRVTSNYMVLTGDTDLTVKTIIGGYEGQILTLEFGDSRVTIYDNDSSDNNSVNLAGAATNFLSTPNDVMQLICNGVSWREIARSVN